MADSTRGIAVMNTALSGAGINMTATPYNISEVYANLVEDVGESAYTTMNRFLNVLVNKIVFTEVRTKLFTNPLARLKKGNIPMGYSGEFIHTNPAEMEDFTPNSGDDSTYVSPYKKKSPTVFVTYLKRNVDKIGEQTIYDEELREAFTSYDKFDTFVNGIVNSLYSGDAIMEYALVRGTIESAFVQGYIKETAITPITDKTTGQQFVNTLKNASDNFTEPSNENCYTQGAITFCQPENQVIIMRNDVNNALATWVEAWAFNKEKLSFIPQIIKVNQIDNNGVIAAILFDDAWLQIRDKMFRTDTIFNQYELYWNYFLHHRLMAGIINEANARVFVYDYAKVTTLPAETSTGTGNYKVGTQFTIKSTNPSFTKWTATPSAAVTIADANSAETTVTVNEAVPVTITAS